MTWAAMGRCYEALNESQQAQECFLMCATENPADFDSRLRLAEIYEATNRKDEALAIVEAGTPSSNRD
jgi:tetratricopeptide (TPR) repeat protein